MRWDFDLAQRWLLFRGDGVGPFRATGHHRVTGPLDSALGTKRAGTNHASVVAQLGREIVDGTYPEGSILPGDGEMTTRFSVSRTVLREAMKTLAAKRLVEPKAKVGTRVLGASSWNFFDADVLTWRIAAGVDEAFITQLAEIRGALEPAAAVLAARHADRDDILSLYEIAGRMNELSHTPETIARVDLEFHKALGQASRNPFMVSAGHVIEAALALSFKLSSPARTTADMEDFARNHLRIVRAIAAGDEARAAQAMGHVIKVGVARACLALSGGPA